MEVYTTPKIEIIELDNSDVITTSAQFPEVNL